MAPLIQDPGDAAPIPKSRKSRYILVAESDSNDLFTTAMLLHRFSYPVCTARDARQALDMVSVAVPALVIADHSLPDMNGIDLLRALGRDAHTFSLPVIVLMPADGAGPAEQDFEIGGTFILRKPVTVDDLYRAVQTAMEHVPRTSIRVPTVLPVTVNKVTLDSSRGECAVNLSAQGMYIRTFKHYRRNESLAVQLNLAGRTISADAKVVYTRRQDDGPFAVPGMAVTFTGIAGEDRERIKRFVRDEVTRGIVAAEAGADTTAH